MVQYLGYDVSAHVLKRPLRRDDVAVHDVDSSDVVDGVVGMGYGDVMCFDGSYLPHWVLHPVHDDVELLKQIERWCFNGWIQRGLYTLWVESIFPLYTSDTSVNSQQFWDTACKNIKKHSTDESHIVKVELQGVQLPVKTECC